MSPYAIFAQVVQENPERTFRDVWEDFACWEAAREYADDPDTASKDAIGWIRNLDELALRLADYQDPEQGCLNALEAAAIAFARIDHGVALYDAVMRWRTQRLEEKQS